VAGLLPLLDPAFNRREVAKQLVLLEDHLAHPRRRCPDCIRKHLLAAEAFSEEAVTLDTSGRYPDLAELAETCRALWWAYLAGTPPDLVGQDARALRKRLSAELAVDCVAPFHDQRRLAPGDLSPGAAAPYVPAPPLGTAQAAAEAAAEEQAARTAAGLRAQGAAMRAETEERYRAEAAARLQAYEAKGQEIAADFRARGEDYAKAKGAEAGAEAADWLKTAAKSFLVSKMLGAEGILGASRSAAASWLGGAVAAVGTYAAVFIFLMEVFEEVGGVAWLRSTQGLSGDAKRDQVYRSARAKMCVEAAGLGMGEERECAWWNAQLDGLNQIMADAWAAKYQAYMDECSIWQDIGWFVSGGVVDAIFGSDISYAEHCSHHAQKAANDAVWIPYWKLIPDIMRGTMLEGAYGPTAAWVWSQMHGAAARPPSSWWDRRRGAPTPAPPQPAPVQQAAKGGGGGGGAALALLIGVPLLLESL